MATVQELLRRVEALIDDTLDNATVVAWFNGAQAALSDVIYIPTKQTITRDGTSGGFAFPANCAGLLTITDPTDITGYEVYDGFMYLSGGSAESTPTVTVVYNRQPVDVTNDPSSVPELATMYHDAYVLWACMQAMNPEEEPTRYAQYERDFTRLKSQLATYYGKLRVKPTRWGVSR